MKPEDTNIPEHSTAPAPEGLATEPCSPCLDSSSMAGSIVRDLENHSLHGRRIGTSDADKLKMIREFLRRKEDYPVTPQIVKRWISERGLF